MNIAICDDNIQDAQEISALLQDHFDKNGYMGNLRLYHSGEALIEDFSYHHFDVVFLDIYMNGMGGIDTAEQLRKISPDFALVFITLSEDHALDAFSLGADYYVIKPIDRDSIDKAFAKCRHIFLANGKYILVPQGRSRSKVPLIKTMYFEVFGKDIWLHTTDKSIKTSTPLDEWMNLLPASSFIRCHRSYIVNLNHIMSIEQDHFAMRDGNLIPIRQRGRSKIKETYADFISDKLFEVTL